MNGNQLNFGTTVHKYSDVSINTPAPIFRAKIYHKMAVAHKIQKSILLVRIVCSFIII